MHKKPHKSFMRQLFVPVVVTIVVVLFAGCITGLAIWAFLVDPPPLLIAIPLAILIISLPLFVILGIISSLIERVRELEGGEEDAASKY